MSERARSEPGRDQGQQGVDLRLVPAALATWAGMWLTTSGQLPALVCTAVLALVLAGIAAGRRSLPAGLACVVLVGSLLVGGLRAHALATGPVATLAAQRAVVGMVVRLSSEPTTFQSRMGWGEQVRFRADVVQLEGRGQSWALVQAVDVEANGEGTGSWAQVPVGATVRLTARLGAADVADGVAATVRPLTPPDVRTSPAWWLRAVEVVRTGLREAASTLPGDRSALVPALTLGDTSRVSPTMRDQFRATGLTHIMAVSGANLALLLAFVVLVAKWCGVGGRRLAGLSVATVAAFVVLCRAEPSVVRAAAMGVVTLAALGREAGRGGGVRLVSVSVVVLCFVDPWLSRSWGFALSVAACLGIVWWGRRWARALGHWLPGWLAEALAVPLSAQVATQPLVTALSGQVSVVGVPANALAGPFVGPATVLGFACAGVAWLLPDVGRILAWAAGWASAPILAVARVGASLPGATVAWPSSAVAIGLVVVACLAFARVAPSVLRRWWLTLPLALALVLALLRAPYHLGWPPPSWQMVACDVGQGDATVVSAAPGQAVLVDTGPDPVALLRCLDQVGIEAVPLLVLTHYHADHVGGLAALLASRPVGRAIVSPLASPAATAAAIRLELEDRGIPVTTAATGDDLVVGRARWQTVAASSDIGAGVDAGESSAENNSSIVGRVSVPGLSVLVTGDIEPEGQEAAVASGVDLNADVLKVPHHGSSRQSGAFLAATHATVALVEVGLGNTYGHPAAKTLRTLEGLGMQVVRTDQRGAVAVGVTSGSWTITTLR
ncbi:MAG TPA: ComEC/Rec2 family competence protein [Propionibacteriaceae bacterium]|nr:ComEC/Rec2 family competence protein [Propionibacteriaceae bacterium]